MHKKENDDIELFPNNFSFGFLVQNKSYYYFSQYRKLSNHTKTGMIRVISLFQSASFVIHVIPVL